MYTYLRLPSGIFSGPDTIHQLFENIDGVQTIVDDIIVYGATEEDHDQSLKVTLDTVCKVNLKLNKAKCEVGVYELTFIRHQVTAVGVKPEPAKVSAINRMEKCANEQDLQRFMGLVTYLAKWIPTFFQKTTLLRELLQQKIAWR